MAYPVHTHNKKRKDPKITGALSEMVPGNPVMRKKIRPMVHFAIEPRNGKLKLPDPRIQAD